jgi:hypothetical protein
MFIKAKKCFFSSPVFKPRLRLGQKRARFQVMVAQRKCVAIFVLHINYQYASSLSNLQFCAVTMTIEVATVAGQLEISLSEFKCYRLGLS